MEVVSRRGDHGCLGRWNDREALRETHGRSDQFQAVRLARLLQQVTMSETAIAAPDPRQKVLITGGAGFIGAAVARALLQRGTPVVVVDQRAPAMIERGDPIAGA